MLQTNSLIEVPNLTLKFLGFLIASPVTVTTLSVKGLPVNNTFLISYAVATF